MNTDRARHRFTVEQYERMVEAGVLTSDDRVELIEGEIVEMAPISPEHCYTVSSLADLFIRGLGDWAAVFVQGAVKLPPDSEPEPDVMVARPPLDRYRHRHPEPHDVLLAVEVAKTSADYDRFRKIPLYARRGIPEAWLVDVPNRRVEAHTDPTPDGYGTVRVVEGGEAIAPQAFGDLRIDLAEILP